MKKVNIIFVILLSITGCGGNKRSINQNDAFIVVDVTAKYPKIELILQDFMDVEYIALETTDGFLCQGLVLAVGNEIILVKNQIDDGDIFVYDRAGQALRIINRKGQGREEYSSIIGVTLDEENNEMFVNDIQRIIVYDLYGKFSRSFAKEGGARNRNMLIHNFDKENLICQASTTQIDNNSTESLPFVIMSKKDGSIVKDIRIQFKQGVSTMITVPFGELTSTMYPAFNTIIPSHNSWILMDPSSDTIFNLLPDYSMIPFMVRTPTIYSMNPEIFLRPGIFTDRYYFMETLRREYSSGAIGLLPTIQLFYDRQEKKIYEYTVNNDDYVNKNTISFSTAVKSHKIPFWQKIEAFELVESYEKEELKGKLKEIAAKLDEGSNPVIMLVKNKN